MSDIRKGYAFSGSSPNNNVTSEKLNNLVDDATILTTFITEKSELTEPDAGDYLVIYDASTDTLKKVKKSVLVTSASALTGARNLVITNNTATPNSQVDVTADEIIVRTSSGIARHISSFSRTGDITQWSSGSTPDGRDDTNALASTWYYIWAISDGTNDRLLFSASAASPTLPTGYTYKALLGEVRNDASSNFCTFVQRGADVVISSIQGAATTSATAQVPQTGGAEFTSVAVTTDETWQTADLARCIPPNATLVHGILGKSATGSDGVAYVASKATGTVGTPTLRMGMLFLQLKWQGASMDGWGACAPFTLPIHTPQTISWSTDGAALFSMRIVGYRRQT